VSRGRSWLGGAVLLAASACAPQRHPETPVLPTASLHLPALMDVMEAGLDVPEPSANVVVKATGASLFGGSYDWHSCIFAHWALLAQARRDGDRERAARMLARLSEDALLEERARLRSPEFEARMERGSLTYAYGLGWLLQLLTEVERQRAPSAEVAGFRDEVERSLLDVAEERTFPELGEDRALEGRRVIGYYNSVPLTWYQLASAGVRTEGAAERLERVRAARLAPWAEQLTAAADPERFEFLWVQTLGYLVASVAPQGGPQGWSLAPYELDDRDVLPDEVTMRTTHLLGVHASRLWPLALRAREDAAAAEQLDRELMALLERRELWDGDFAVVSHWMPQFTWMNFWLAGAGR